MLDAGVGIVDDLDEQPRVATAAINGSESAVKERMDLPEAWLANW
jgi:hypothetical protein